MKASPIKYVIFYPTTCVHWACGWHFPSLFSSCLVTLLSVFFSQMVRGNVRRGTRGGAVSLSQRFAGLARARGVKPVGVRRAATIGRQTGSRYSQVMLQRTRQRPSTQTVRVSLLQLNFFGCSSTLLF